MEGKGEEAMSLTEKIKQKAKMGTEIENLLDTDLEEEWQKVAEIQWVRLDDVLKILEEEKQRVPTYEELKEAAERKKLTKKRRLAIAQEIAKEEGFVVVEYRKFQDFHEWLVRTEWRGVSSEMLEEFQERFQDLSGLPKKKEKGD